MLLPDHVRAFNRFYTKQIGLLRDGYLQSPFSLTQARVLYEVGSRPGIRWSELLKDLALDPGYLSRLIRNFEARGLVRRAPSLKDRRVSHLSLSARGRAQFAKLNARSQRDAAAMLAKLTAGEQRRLVAGMNTIRQILDPSVAQAPLTLRPHQPGDIGWVISRHGAFYAEEYNWEMTFEALVAEIAGKFLKNFNPARERCWIAERNGERAGCIFCVRHTDRIAKLRLLLVDPSARGTGLGTRLVEECIDFARRAGYKKIVLWTDNHLHAARRIYERAGFVLVKEEKHHSFGHDLTGQFWERKLSVAPNAVK